MLACSGFFSMSETCMMALNRYRLRHLVREGSRGARMAQALLARTDELLAFILAGNTVINAATTILVAEIARRLLGEGEFTLAIATGAASFAILVFAEILPKVLGATYSEPIALGASYLLTPLLRVTKPFMYLINLLVRGILAILRIKQVGEDAQPLSMGELRTLVLEGGKFIPKKHQSIFLNLFELEDMTIDDTMTPRTHIESIDIAHDIDEINTRVSTSHHTRLVVYEGSLDKVVGILHVRKFLNASRKGALTKDEIVAILREPYFVPEGTPLLDQLQNFQDRLRHVALVVDEYGEILGLCTLQDILEEIVGEFTSQSPMAGRLYSREADGTVIADGACPLRVLNRKAGFDFPLDGPKTVNGIVLEELEDIPEPGTHTRIAGYPMEVIQVQNRMVKVVRILPRVTELDSEEQAA
ncbi:magnesium and cobalt efflux protein CorC [Betaproteobacteria bacterium GR16-43]|nr:magnesium and cobalt efflux protein CorC [Betaproteobacteria bacterium GR16-43]